jgi:hypothetical protein
MHEHVYTSFKKGTCSGFITVAEMQMTVFIFGRLMVGIFQKQGLS